MAEPVKYRFDQAFDGGAKSRYDEDLERVRAEAERMQSDAYSQGVEEGRKQALGEIENATKGLLAQIEQAAHGLFSQRAQLESSLKQEMVQLAYAIASKLAPALLRSHPMAEIEALIEDCMATMVKEPRLVVRVSEPLVDPVNDRLEDLKAATSFPGDIVLVGEPSFGPQDCRVEWPDGGTERKHDVTISQIESAVQRFVMPEDVPAPAAAQASESDEADPDSNAQG
ncbi:FliH/SctL family protein [Kordiimonas aestuarii]|uniref:FliH/SctL family protein n=1 Tax=Kordiimonas aestuarii TaxID=1005925 RepID=UPI0021D06D9C|nr:FliH/SctL family protein [Kordiimonas aestuarii]